VCHPGGFVRVTFFQNGEEYDVERGFTSSSSPYLTLKKNQEPIDGNIKELEKVIEDVIGLDYDGFRNSTFVRQDEMKDLGAESAAKRLEIFQKLFRLETFEKAQSLVSQKLDRIKKSVANLTTEISVRSEQVSKLPKLEEELEEKKDQMEKEKGFLKELTEKFEDLNKELEILQKKHDEFSSVKGRRVSAENNLKRIQNKLKSAEQEMKNVEPLKMEIATLEKETKEYEALRTQGEELREKQHAHQALRKEMDRELKLKSVSEKEHDAEVKKLNLRISEYEKRIAGLSTRIGKEEAFDLLRSEGSLKERLNRIEMELVWLSENKDLVKELKTEKKKAKMELSKVKKETSNINEDSFVLSEIKANIAQLKSDSEEVKGNFQKKKEEIEIKIKNTENELNALGFGEEQRTKITTIRTKVARIQKMKNELEVKRKKMEGIGDAGNLIKDLESRQKSLVDESNKLETKLTELKNEEQKYQRTKKVQRALQKDKEILFGKISRAEGEIARLDSQIKDLKDLRKMIKETGSQLKKLQDKGEVFHILREKVFHKRGIVMYAIDQLLPQLSLETSQNLSDMTDGRFSKLRLASYGENNRYGIRIEVAGADGKWHDVQEFSGGEKTQINAALRFAIAKELASMPQVGRTYGRMKTLFIDEGDLGSLDTESSRQLFVSKLFDMGQFFEKIILITHLSEVAEKFPHRIMVYMTAEEESKIKVMA
jgi:DNA repair exonuclease SbcCD ATPase subunit